MSLALHPITTQRLKEVAARGRWLVLVRGLAATASVAVLLILICVVADALFILTDSVRYGLSAGIYLVCGWVGWMGLIRPMIHGVTSQQVAETIEATHPSLRGNLLSAMELAEDRHLRGSVSFLKVLQQRVAEQVESVDARKVLPWQLVRKPVCIGLISLGVFLAMMFIPGLGMPQRVLRSLFPTANLARVSSTRISVIRPQPASGIVPAHEGLAIEVLVEEPIHESAEPSPVFVEVVSPHPQRGRQQLHRAGDRALGQIEVGDQRIEYRIHAGSGLTEFFWLDPKPRPRVSSFLKGYHYPQYSGLESTTVSETDGDLTGIAGTVVELTVIADQPLRQAYLEWQTASGSEVEKIPLKPIDKSRWEGELKLEEPGEYRVRMTALETGFDNALGPPYRITPQVDQPPRIEWLSDSPPSLLGLDAIVRCQVKAVDELPLKMLNQEVSVNGGEWSGECLARHGPAQITHEWNWDLLPLQLKVGDQVRMRVTATDVKGQVGTSPIIEFLVGSSDLDPLRHQLVEARCRLVPFVETYAETMSSLQAKAQPLIKELAARNLAEDVRRKNRQALQDLARESIKLTRELGVEVLRVQSELIDAEDAAELELLGGMLGRIEFGWLTGCEAMLATDWLALADRELMQDQEQLLRRFHEAFESAKQLRDFYKTAVSHDVIVALANDIRSLQQHQGQSENKELASSWITLSRHQTVTVRRLSALAQLSQRLSRYVRNDCQHSLNHFREHFIRPMIDHLEEALSNGEDLTRLHGTARRIAEQLGHHRGLEIDQGIRWALPEARHGIEQRQGVVYRDLHECAQAMAAVADHWQALSSQKDIKGNSQQLQQLGERLQRLLTEVHLPSIQQLPLRRQLRQGNREGEPTFASDLGLAERALQAVLQPLTASDNFQAKPPTVIVENLRAIADAVQVLEIGERFITTADRFRQLSGAERWHGQSVSARLEHWRSWTVNRSRVEQVRYWVNDAKFQPATREAVQRWVSLPEFHEASAKFDQFHGDNGSWATAADELRKIVLQASPMFEVMEPDLEAARDVLRKFAPTLEEMGSRAVEELQKLKMETERLAEKVEDSTEPVSSDVQFDAQRENAQAELDRLADAILQEANRQDLSSPAGRKVAAQADEQLKSLARESKPLQQALAAAEGANTVQEQEAQLRAAIEREENLIKQLQQIAEQIGEHGFKGQESGSSNKSQNRPQYKDQRYEQAERYSRLTEAAPEDSLRQLEESLKRSPEMQAALSEIARQITDESLAKLHYAAKQEHMFQSAMERSDQALYERKRELAEELHGVHRMLQDMAYHVLAPAAERSHQAGLTADHGRLREAQRTTLELAQQLQKASAEQTMREIQELADLTKNQANQLEEQVAQSNKDLQAASQRSPTDLNDQQRQQRQRELENAQEQFRRGRINFAQERLNHAKQLQRQADDHLKNIERQVKDRQQQLERAQKNLEKQPEHEGWKTEVHRAGTELALARQDQQRAEDRKRLAENTARQRQESFQAASADRLPPLSAENKTAELARQLTQHAMQTLKEVREIAEKIQGDPSGKERLEPTLGENQGLAVRQAHVQEDVAGVAEDLARASRHKQRLGDQDASRQLAQHEEQVRQTAQTDVEQASRRLQEASVPADPKAPTVHRTPADGSKSMAARSAVHQAELAIKANLQALQDWVNPAPDEDQASSTREPSANGKKATTRDQQSTAKSAQSKARQMAQLLDELDQSEASSRTELPTLQEAAREIAQSLRWSRMASRQAMRLSSSEGTESGNQIGSSSNGTYKLIPVERDRVSWGELRQQSVEDLREATNTQFTPEYQQMLEVYYRLLSERARLK